jgi:tRNA pseudouridine32 synthase/23S rRNA pseudouridine746 synthase
MSAPLPTRDGVKPSTLVLPQGAWPSLLDFLATHFNDVGREAWRSRFARELVCDASGHALREDTPYRVGLSVHYYRELPPEVPIPFSAQILYRDDHLLVADKPHFLPVLPSGRYLQETLLVRLRRETGIDELSPLHRIDRDTAGLVLFSCCAASRGAYQALFTQRTMQKTYEALAPLLPLERFPLVYRSRLVRGEPFYRTHEVAGEANSETRIEIAETRGAVARYRLFPLTGRKHQLRVHLASLGAPIVNDPLYPDIRSAAPDDFTHPLQLLARELRFVDPLNGRLHGFSSRRSLLLDGGDA